MHLFPDIADDAAYDAIYKQESALQPTIDALRAPSAFGAGALERWEVGSALLYGLGEDRVFKVYPPLYAEEALIEERVHRAAYGADLGLEIPELLDVGEAHGWRWLLMRRLPGVCAKRVWEDVPHASKVHIMGAPGVWMRRFHHDSGVQAVRVPERPDKIPGLRAQVCQTHRRRGATEGWLAQIESFLGEWRPEDARHIVHADLHPGNLMLQEVEGGWRLTGILDFADTWSAPLAYDLGAPLVYMAGGDAGLTRALLDGVYAGEWTHSTRALFSWVLIHQFSSLSWYVSMLKRWGEPEPETLDALAIALLGDLRTSGADS